MAEAPAKLVWLGRIVAVHGVRGWVRIYSYTQPWDNILVYSPWLVSCGEGWQRLAVDASRRQGQRLLAHLAGVDDRHQARALIGADIAVERDRLPEPEAGEYYWTDLEGLQVLTVSGESLGRVSHLLATGANDVLVVHNDRERLIPFVQGEVVQEVDLTAGVMRVDWDPEL